MLFVMATWTQTLPDRIDAPVAMLEAFGGVHAPSTRTIFRRGLTTALRRADDPVDVLSWQNIYPTNNSKLLRSGSRREQAAIRVVRR